MDIKMKFFGEIFCPGTFHEYFILVEGPGKIDLPPVGKLMNNYSEPIGCSSSLSVMNQPYGLAS